MRRSVNLPSLVLPSLVLPGALLSLALVASLGLLPATDGGVEPASARAAAPAAPARDPRPDIVLVQMDDVSLDLMATMRHARSMRDEGAWFANSYVVNTLCCPSRAAMFTGRAPHNNRVLTNTASPRQAQPQGGWRAYRKAGNPRRTFHLALQRSGYTTGFVGKFLNGYTARNAVPVRGWSEFRPVFGTGYRGWDYEVGEQKPSGRVDVRRVEAPPASAGRAEKDRAYVQTYMERQALSFIRRHRGGAKPYFYTLSAYAAHSRVGGQAYAQDPKFPAAYADRPRSGARDGNCGPVACRSLDVRDLPGFDDPRGDNRPVRLVGGRPRAADHWRPAQKTHRPGVLTAQRRDRARMLQSLDRTLGRILAAVGDDAYVVLTSDNGFHLGQHRLGGGKGAPYDSDTRVPLYVVGPGVTPGARTQQVTNLDLAPTFERIAGLRPEGFRDGVSFANLLGDRRGPGGRFTFFEHTHDPDARNDPDRDAALGSRLPSIPSYLAVRSGRGLLVRLDLDASPRRTTYAWELYTYDRHRYERTNVFRQRYREPWVRDLRRRIEQWERCAPQKCRSLTR